MSGDIADQPLARALLRHLAAHRGKDDPVGSLARTVLAGEANLRTAAANPWHSEGLATSLAAAQAERERLTPEQRAAYEQDAERLRRQADGSTEDGDR